SVDGIFGLHMAMAEKLVGPKVWTLYGFKPAGIIYRTLREAILTFLYIDLCISKRFRLWQTIRNFAFCFVIQGLVDSELKGRTNFALKSPPTIDKENNDNSSSSNDHLEKSIPKLYEQSVAKLTWTFLITVFILVIAISYV